MQEEKLQKACRDGQKELLKQAWVSQEQDKKKAMRADDFLLRRTNPGSTEIKEDKSEQIDRSDYFDQSRQEH